MSKKPDWISEVIFWLVAILMGTIAAAIAVAAGELTGYLYDHFGK